MTNNTASASADLSRAEAALSKIRTIQAETLEQLAEMKAEFANVSMFAEVDDEWLVSRDTLRTAIDTKERRLTDLKAALDGAKAMVEAARVRMLAARQVTDRQTAVEHWDSAANTAEQLHDALIVVGELWANMNADLEAARYLITPHVPAHKRAIYAKVDILEQLRFVLQTSGGPSFPGEQSITQNHFKKHPPSLGGSVAIATDKLRKRLDLDLGPLPADEQPAAANSSDEKAA
jgi:hypothetical protein